MVAPLAVDARNPNLGSFETNGRDPHRLAKRPLQSAIQGWTVQHSMAGPFAPAAPINFATDRFARRPHLERSLPKFTHEFPSDNPQQDGPPMRFADEPCVLPRRRAMPSAT